jgi:hypothetical protein
MQYPPQPVYQFLDHLPAIPQTLLTGFQHWVNNDVKYNGSSYRTGERQGERLQNAHFSRHHISAELEQWLADNISDQYSDIGIIYTRGHSEHLPHTDGFRDYSINYLLDRGGDAVDTVFYHEQGTDSLTKPRGHWPKDLNLVREIDRVRIPLQRWIMLNTQVLHGVIGITGMRTQISLSFVEFPDCAKAD